MVLLSKFTAMVLVCGALQAADPKALLKSVSSREQANEAEVILHLDENVRYTTGVLTAPDRIWIDLAGTSLAGTSLAGTSTVTPGLNRVTTGANSFVRNIRFGQRAGDVVRVVVDVTEPVIFEVHSRDGEGIQVRLRPQSQRTPIAPPPFVQPAPPADPPRILPVAPPPVPPAREEVTATVVETAQPSPVEYPLAAEAGVPTMEAPASALPPPVVIRAVPAVSREDLVVHRGVVQSLDLPIPGASVTARLGDLTMQTVTGDDGSYAFSDVVPGRWTLEVEMPGFETVSGEIVAGVAQPVPEPQVWALKMIGATDPPVSAQRSVVAQAAGPGKFLQANLSAAAPVPVSALPEDISELEASANEALVLNGGAPVAGRNTPQYHGNAGLSLNNSAFDARAYSLTGQRLAKPSRASSRISASFGGPVRIPKLVTGENTSFTLSYNAGRTRNWNSFTSTMPSELERLGDFSQSVQRGPISLYEPGTGQPLPGNRIPVSRLDPAAVGLATYLPLPNQPGQVQNYQFVAVAPSKQNSLNANVNHRINRRNRLSGSISRQWGESVSPQLIGVSDTNQTRGWNGRLTWGATLAPRLVSTLRADFNLFRNEVLPYFAYRENVAAKLGIVGTAQEPRNWGPPNLSFTNFGGLGSSNTARTATHTHTLSENLTWSRGKHNLDFGGEYAQRQNNRVSDLNARGSLSFTGWATSREGAGGFDFADFLLGLPQTSSVRFGGGDTYFRSHGLSAFVQDDWRIAARLTLNLGLRYDYSSPIREKYNRMANLAVTPGFTAVRPILSPETLVRPDRNNVSPRFGLAWRPSGQHSAVVRAGYGWYYNTNVYAGLADNLAQQPPFANATTVASSADRPLTIRNAFGGAVVRQVANTYAVDPAYRVGYAQSWNVSIEQNLGSLLVGEVTYLGTRGSGLDMLSVPNRYLPSTVSPFIYESSAGRSIYHGGSARIARRFSGGLTGQLRYTYSKSIDNASSVTGSGFGSIVQNAFDFAAERGLSSFDVRHLVEANWQYSTPSTGSWLVRGWMVSSTITFRTGSPLTATVLGNRADVAGTGITGTVRADATGLPIRSDSGFFNTNAFVVPSIGQFGNASRGTIPGPGAFLVNGSVTRTIPVGDRRAVELLLDASNILNHVNITRYGTVVNASNYGLATGAGSMRTLNTQVRFRF